ncbi:MAG: hypothetical protein JWL81_628, partial [Verrucomicrobiales bacterium]|nr:hypothetical protein [Verrucomicrobiales bacterium]
LRTGQVEVLTNSPVNQVDGRNPKISHDGNSVVIQAGPERALLQPYLYTVADGWKAIPNLRPTGEDIPLAVNDRGDVVGNAGDGFQGGGSIPFIYPKNVS